MSNLRKRQFPFENNPLEKRTRISPMNDLWVYNDQLLRQNKKLFTKIDQLSIQTFGSSIVCVEEENCAYFIFTQGSVTEDEIDSSFAGMFIAIKNPNVYYHEIYNVVTLPTLRGQGVAKMMIPKGIHYIRNVYPDAVFWLAIDPDSTYYDASVKTYIRSGFTIPRIFSKSPSGKSYNKAMIAMTTDTSEPYPGYTLTLATELRVYALQCNKSTTINIDVESIKQLYEYNVNNTGIQGTREMGGHFTINPTTGVHYINKFEPFTVFPNPTQEEVNERSLTYDALWGQEASAMIPHIRVITWHTHPYKLVYNTDTPESFRIVDVPSQDDMALNILYPMFVPQRLHILFSYEYIYLLRMSNVFATVVSYLRQNNYVSVYTIYGCVRKFLMQLYENLSTDLFTGKESNITKRVNLLSTWCDIGLKQVISSYSNSNDKDVQNTMGTLNNLMSQDEPLFNVNAYRYADVAQLQLFPVTYYQI